MPSIIEQSEIAAGAISFPSTQELTSFLEHSWAIERRLRLWYRGLIGFPRILYSEHQALSMSPRLRHLSPISLYFPSFDIARMHLFYWAALLLIYSNIRSLQHLLHPDLSPTTLDPTILLINSKIVQSIPYLLSPSAHIMGPQNVFFPLRIAQHSFSQLTRKEDEEEWCRDVFDELDRRGFPFGKI